jgi:hypothetical protein
LLREFIGSPSVNTAITQQKKKMFSASWESRR